MKETLEKIYEILDYLSTRHGNASEELSELMCELQDMVKKGDVAITNQIRAAIKEVMFPYRYGSKSVDKEEKPK